MSYYQATYGHRNSAGDESPGRHLESRSGPTQGVNRQKEAQVDDAQPEEGDVPEAIETVFKTGVAAEPVLPMEKQAEQHPREEAERNPNPGENQVLFVAIAFRRTVRAH